VRGPGMHHVRISFHCPFEGHAFRKICAKSRRSLRWSVMRVVDPTRERRRRRRRRRRRAFNQKILRGKPTRCRVIPGWPALLGWRPPPRPSRTAPPGMTKTLTLRVSADMLVSQSRATPPPGPSLGDPEGEVGGRRRREIESKILRGTADSLSRGTGTGLSPQVDPNPLWPGQ
jgi:hypothetical protein